MNAKKIIFQAIALVTQRMWWRHGKKAGHKRTTVGALTLRPSIIRLLVVLLILLRLDVSAGASVGMPQMRLEIEHPYDMRGTRASSHPSSRLLALNDDDVQKDAILQKRALESVSSLETSLHEVESGTREETVQAAKIESIQANPFRHQVCIK